MSTAETPTRDRITAITIVVLVHALAILPVMVRQAGGRPGQDFRDAVGEGQEAWIAVDFQAKRGAPKPRRATNETLPPPVQAEDSPAGEPVPAQASAAASDKAPEEVASPEDARKGGGTAAPQHDLGARYFAAVRAAVLDKWNAQGGGTIPGGCKVVIDQAMGGRALRAWVMQCADLPLPERIRLEAAVMRVQTLPYEGFEPVFQEHMELEF